MVYQLLFQLLLGDFAPVVRIMFRPEGYFFVFEIITYFKI